jgi:alpha-L-fucosidase
MHVGPLSLWTILVVTGGGLLASALAGRRLLPRAIAIGAVGIVAAGLLVAVHDAVARTPAPPGLTGNEAVLGRARFVRREARALDHRTLARVDQRRLHREALRWFAAGRTGLFVHYGPATLVAPRTNDAFWDGIRGPRYPTQVRAFAPSPRAPESWVRLAREIGASYLTFTVKHHDGFGLWDSPLGYYDVGAEDDLLARLAPLARRSGIKLFVYYSLLDLHEPTFRGDPAAYRQLVRGELTALLTHYGPLGGVWLDGSWDAPFNRRQLESLYALIHRLQPGALVTTNHHGRPLPGEDFQTFEDVFPGERGPDGLIQPQSALPHEVAARLGRYWFWSGPERLSLARLHALEAHARRTGANLLVDVGPPPSGVLGSLSR